MSTMIVVPWPFLHGFADAIDAVAPGVEVLTPTWDLPHELRTLRETTGVPGDEPTPDTEAREAFAAADVILTLDVPADIAELAPNLRWIQAIGSGVGQYAVCDLPDTGITLTNSPGLSAVPIAEWILARILQIYKRLPEHDASQRQATWHSAMGRTLEGSTAAIVGLGAIGRATATRLRAMGVRVVASRRTHEPGMTDPDVDELLGPDDLLDLIADTDIVIVTLPGTAENDDLFDADAFAAMREGAIFLNVGRGSLVDEAALVEALESGHLAAAAIDVAKTEPLPTDDPLWTAPNLLISAHSSSSGDRYLEMAIAMFNDNLGRFLAGEPLRNVVQLTGGY